jgi:tetratricopeptide (TPR) repeat protein
MGSFEDTDRYIRKAMSLRRNLTQRERLLIEGDFFNILESDMSKAIETYQNLLLLYPDDEMALEHLGAIYRNIEEWDEAAECFERLQVINPGRIVARNLSFIYEAKGRYDEAERIIRSHEAILRESGDYLSDQAFCYFCRGKLREAVQVLGEALSQDPDHSGCLRLLGQVHCALGDLGGAEAAYRRLSETQRDEFQMLDDHFWLGQLYLLQGRYQSCLKEIQSGLDIVKEHGFAYEESTFLVFESQLHSLRQDFTEANDLASQARQKAAAVRYRDNEIKALQAMGLCQVERGELLEAQDTLAVMKKIIEKMGFPKLMRACYHLEGMISMARNSWGEAVESFSKAVELLSHQNSVYDRHAFYLESLASALYREGDLESARAQYEKVVSLTAGFMTHGDAYARSLIQLGRIYLAKNDPEKAREYLRRYLTVRAGADAGLPEMEEARRLLTSIP